MSHLHKRFTDHEVGFLLQSYSRRLLSRTEIQDRLKIGKTRFFELRKMYQADPEAFSIGYERPSPGRISPDTEAAIERELLREKELIEDDELPITSYNYSALRDRLLLFADFFSAETTWAHIQATRAVVETFGVPLRCYVDSLRVFRFVQGRDSVWRNHVLQTDDVDTQWGKMMNRLGVAVTYALSPQAKGKVENRPYRWIQDRVVRTCALEEMIDLEQVREVLREEVERYNQRQVHSTTKEIPAIRFDRAFNQANSLFRPFSVPSPYTSPDDH